MNRRTALAFSFIGLLWGSAWIPTTEVLKEVPPLRAGAMRFAVAAAFTGFFALLQRFRFGRLRFGKTSSRIPPALFRNAFVLGVAALALPYALTAWAAPHLSPGGIPVIYAFMPLIALLMSGESAMNAISALVIGISGVVLLVAQGLAFSPAQLGGVLLVVCSVFLGAFSLNYAKRCLRGSDLLLSSAIQFACAAILLGAISLPGERAAATANAAPILWLLVPGILISGVTLPLLYWLLMQVEASQAALLQWISTLVAVSEAALFLHARPSPEQLLGAASIIGATFWLLSRRAPVTPPATIAAIQGPAASHSEVRSK